MTQVGVLKEPQYTMLDSKAKAGDLGMRFRQSRPGPEEELIQLFLEKFQLRIPRGYQATLFKEPRLESGFPDLVAVVWRTATAERWNSNRLLLQNSDIRVMHYITQARATKRGELKALYGSGVKDIIERLEAADMVRQRGQTLKPRSLSKLYATAHIVAIEAKISEWRRALDQAFLNRWFASASYVLLPRIPSGSHIAAQAEFLNQIRMDVIALAQGFERER